MENVVTETQITLCNETPYFLGSCFYYLTRSDPKQKLFVTVGFDYVQNEMILDKDREFKSTFHPSKAYQIYKSLPFEHASNCPCYQMNINSELYSFVPSQRYVKLACCALIMDSKNRLLLTRRTKHLATFPCCWVGPGGRLDKGESLEECVLRESEEEVGIRLDKKSRQNGDIEYSYGGIECEFKPFMVYESVYPTQLDLGFPKSQNLILFYFLRLGIENTRVKVKIQENEVDKAIWISLSSLKAVIEGKIETSDLGCFSVNSAGYPVTDFIPKDHLEGVYPNNIKEGIGEGHLRAIRCFLSSEFMT